MHHSESRVTIKQRDKAYTFKIQEDDKGEKQGILLYFLQAKMKNQLAILTQGDDLWVQDLVSDEAILNDKTGNARTTMTLFKVSEDESTEKDSNKKLEPKTQKKIQFQLSASFLKKGESRRINSSI